jgi:hypothetical protein
MTTRTSGGSLVGATGRSASTTGSIAANSFQRSDRPINPLALSLEISEYILDIHVSPFGSKTPSSVTAWLQSY